MNRKLRNLFLGGSVLAVALCAQDASAATAQRNVKFWDLSYKARTHKGNTGGMFSMSNDAVTRMKAATPSQTINDAYTFDWIDAPDGSTWWYKIDFDIEKQELEGGYASSTDIKAFTITIYDADFKEYGVVKDHVELAEGETRVAQIDLDGTFTKKFYNSDDKYEIAVAFYINTKNYVNNTYTKVYSINGKKEDNGDDVPILSMNGSVADCINASTDKYSETFYVTYMEEIVPSLDDTDSDTTFDEYASQYAVKLTTYKKCGWGDTTPKEVNSITLPYAVLPGDGSAPFFISKMYDGKPYFIVSRYEKSFFASNDPTVDESVTPDNKFMIDVYNIASSYSSEFTKVNQTVIPCETIGGYRFYSVGSFGYRDDISFEAYGAADGKPGFVVTYSDYVFASGSDEYLYTFKQYGPDGTALKTIAESVEGWTNMSDISGFEPQIMFVKTVDDNMIFEFVDVYSAQSVAQFNRVNEEGITYSTHIDRMKVGDSYQYVVEGAQGLIDNDDNTLVPVAWIGADGKLDHIDRLNIGKDVAYAQVHISQSVLSPYLFNTDTKLEYEVLVKRYKDLSVNTATYEEFVVVNSESEVLFKAGSDATKGTLINIMSSYASDSSYLLILYINDENVYTIDHYDLPFTKFAGGEGTKDSPWQISTIADLQMIGATPGTYYVLVNDIDASGFDFKPIETFSGSLDGAGKTINDLYISGTSNYCGLVKNTTEGALFKNLNFFAPTVELNDNNSVVGLLVGSAYSTAFDNVHIYNLKATGTEDTDSKFGSIAGELTNISSVTQCSSVDADIHLANSQYVGGIVGEIYTGSKIMATAFSGNILGGTYVGGIVGSLPGDAEVKDCHVKANNIVGGSSVGGVAGYSGRSPIHNCYVEGKMEATTPNRWSKKLGLGGIVGELQPNPATTDGSELSSDPVVYKNVVNVAFTVPTIEGEPEYASQFSTSHRIVGYSSVNEAPEVTGYDDNWNPIYGDPTAADICLSDNYATGALIDSEIADDAKTTEGKTIAADEISRSFLEGLGFAYGTTTDKPWNTMSFASPSLFFEKTIVINPETISVVAGERFNVHVHVLGVKEITIEDFIGGFTGDWDMDHVEMTGNATTEGNVAAIEFLCLKEGTSQITIGYNGQNAVATVTSVSGVENVVADSASLVYNGSELIAEGCNISVYSVAGMQVATGYDAVSTQQLAPGVYIAVAQGANGNATVKFAVK